MEFKFDALKRKSADKSVSKKETTEGKKPSKGSKSSSTPAQKSTTAGTSSKISMNTAKRGPKDMQKYADKLNTAITQKWDSFEEEEWMTFFFSLSRVDKTGEIAKANLKKSKEAVAGQARKSKLPEQYESEIAIAVKIYAVLNEKMGMDSTYLTPSLVARTEVFKSFMKALKKAVDEDWTESGFKFAIYKRAFYYPMTGIEAMKSLKGRFDLLQQVLTAMNGEGLLEWSEADQSFIVPKSNHNNMRDIMESQMQNYEKKKAVSPSNSIYYSFKAGAVINPNFVFATSEFKQDPNSAIGKQCVAFNREYKRAVIRLVGITPPKCETAKEVLKKDHPLNETFWVAKSILSRTLANMGRTISPRGGASIFEKILDDYDLDDVKLGDLKNFKNSALRQAKVSEKESVIVLDEKDDDEISGSDGELVEEAEDSK